MLVSSRFIDSLFCTVAREETILRDHLTILSAQAEISREPDEVREMVPIRIRIVEEIIRWQSVFL